jgi:hypothetical protein
VPPGHHSNIVAGAAGKALNCLREGTAQSLSGGGKALGRGKRRPVVHYGDGEVQTLGQFLHMEGNVSPAQQNQPFRGLKSPTVAFPLRLQSEAFPLTFPNSLQDAV